MFKTTKTIRITSIVLVFALIAGLFIFLQPFFKSSEVKAEDNRGGFILEPDAFDETGVKTDSSFTLKSANNFSVEEISEMLSIDGEPSPDIQKIEDRVYKIILKQPLKQASLYTFRIRRKNTESEDITWTFQTSSPLRILGHFPADKSSSVPLNTGIEIYFNYENYEDPAKYFEITPSVPGRFERHKKAAVFVPTSNLKEGTIYTVRIKKGIKVSGTENALQNDLVFSFETQISEKKQNQFNKGYISFNRLFTEFASDEKPFLPINYWVDKSQIKAGEITVKTNVYSYKDMNSFIESIFKKSEIPGWAYYNYAANTVPVSGLNKVASFDTKLPSTPDYEKLYAISLPEALPQGFYIVESKWENITMQAFIQVTDIVMFIMDTTDKTLLWLNDASTKKAVADAQVQIYGIDKSSKTNSDGIAVFDETSNLIKEKIAESRTLLPYQHYEYLPVIYTIISKEGKQAAGISGAGFGYHYKPPVSSLYWNFLQLDRNLYKPDDYVNLWGFIKNRYSNEKISELTVELSQPNYYFPFRGYDYPAVEMKSSRAPAGRREAFGFWPYFDAKPLMVEKIKVENGVFSHSIKLPNLSPGDYNITIKKGDEAIASSYVSVQNYIKPAYKLEVETDKKAVFAGESVKFKLKASFFEGTGVPELDISYSFYDPGTGSSVGETVKTDNEGQAEVVYTPKYSSNMQGETQMFFNSNASLPESGQIYAQGNVRVFMNDINAVISGDYKDGKATLKAKLNKIVLDRINDGTAKDMGDFLGDPVSSKLITGHIYKNWYEKREVGEYYDFINKVTQKRYEYIHRKQSVSNVSMTTDSEGNAVFIAELPKPDEFYYTAGLSFTDGFGHVMKYETYIGNIWYYSPYDMENRYYLDSEKEKYKYGEDVGLLFKKGTKTMPQGSYMFAELQNGLKEYKIQQSPQYSFVMNDKRIPNIMIKGVYFTGSTYIQAEYKSISYDYEERKLNLEAKTDKDSYKPGEEVIVKINAKDVTGAPAKNAHINVSAVDEALFKLMERYDNTLEQLYSYVYDGLISVYSSHNLAYQENMFAGKDENQAVAAEAKMEKAKSASPAMELDDRSQRQSIGGFGEGDRSETELLREEFKDAALFKTIALDEKGEGKVSFKLPHNVTAWRISLSAVSYDLKAGSEKVELKATLPFFINYSANNIYLDGDKPVIGVSAYGNDLKKGEKVYYEIYDEDNPNLIAKATGNAFERVNIPIWILSSKTSKNGKNSLIIKASSSNGLHDSVKHEMFVMETFHEIEKAEHYEVKEGIVFNAKSGGNIKLIFSDMGTGKYIPELINLMYWGGTRVDQLMPSAAASALIEAHFKGIDIQKPDNNIDFAKYQQSDGGLSILPYAQSDPDVSARLASIAKNYIDANKLKQYFYGLLENDEKSDDYAALYGLAVLREPVLVNLAKTSNTLNLNVKDYIYIALAYAELGEKPVADKIYTERIQPLLKNLSPVYMVDAGKDRDDVLEATALCAYLASKIDRPEKEGLFEYAKSNYGKDIVVNPEKMLYIVSQTEKAVYKPSAFSYTWQGKTYEQKLEHGNVHTITVPASLIKDFRINKATGSIAAALIYKTSEPFEALNDGSVKIIRKYASKFKQSLDGNKISSNDVVRVELDVEFSPKSMEGSYVIEDYLPAGLKPLDNPFAYNSGVYNENDVYYPVIDKQKVTFTVYNYADPQHQNKTVGKKIVYYARVVSPGKYNVDGPTAKPFNSDRYVFKGQRSQIEIN